MRNSLDAIARSLERTLDKVQPERHVAGDAAGQPTTGTACAWCGRPVTEEEAFMLRVGARLCPSCAEEAGRIAAEQRLGK
jgi:CRISPR/Cas system-associated protein Cas10 (large subunit of type III CRISPR-Cas system)